MRARLTRFNAWGPFRSAHAQQQAPAPAEQEPLQGLEPPPEPPVSPVVVPRWVQAVMLPLALLGLYELARAAGSVLLIFLFASVIALLLNPLAKQFERTLPRGLSIAAVYLAGLAVLAVIGFLLSSPIGASVNRFERNVPHLVSLANHELTQVQQFFDRHGIKIHIKQQGQSALTSLEHTVLKSSGSIVSFSRNLLGQIVTLGVDIILTFVLSVYLLVYARQIGELVRRIMPPGDGTPEDDFPLLVQKAVSGYMRGQILFSLIMGTSAAISLWVFGIAGVFPDGSHYAAFFGAFYGIAEFVPYIGPIIGPAPAVLVALFTNPISALWVVLLFVVLQQLEGHIVAPQVFRISLRINPIIVILSLLFGYQIYGIAGALIALPLATITRATIVYLRRHLVLESWGTAAPPAPVLPPSAPPPGPPGGAAPGTPPSAAVTEEADLSGELELEQREVTIHRGSS